MTLGLELKCERFNINNNEDFLIITLNLIGGENSSLRLHDISARIQDIEGEVKFIDFKGYERVCITKIKNNLKIDQSWKLWEHDKYNLASKESTTFSEMVKVSTSKFYKVEVVIAGSRKRSAPNISQWRASCISPPS